MISRSKIEDRSIRLEQRYFSFSVMKLTGGITNVVADYVRVYSCWPTESDVLDACGQKSELPGPAGGKSILNLV